MTHSLLRGAALLALSVIGLLAPGGRAAAQPVTTSVHQPPGIPNCGGPQPGVTLPRPNADGDRLYYRIVDSAGYDFEIWCRSGVAELYYEYRISFPDGTWAEIDECELFMGSNVVKLDIDGDSITNDTTPNGGRLQRLRGRIGRYRHHNFNSSKDFHTFLDFGTGRVRRIDTRAVRDGQGRTHREVTGSSEWTIDIPRPRPTGTPGSSIAPVHGGTIVRAVARDPAMPFCTTEDSDSLAVVEHFLDTDPAGTAAYYLAHAGIETVVADGGAVTASLAAERPSDWLSIVVPVAADGERGLARVTVDGVETPSEQEVSGSLRTVRVAVPPEARSLRIAAPPRRLGPWLPWLVTAIVAMVALWLARRPPVEAP